MSIYLRFIAPENSTTKQHILQYKYGGSPFCIETEWRNVTVEVVSQEEFNKYCKEKQ